MAPLLNLLKLMVRVPFPFFSFALMLFKFLSLLFFRFHYLFSWECTYKFSSDKRLVGIGIWTTSSTELMHMKRALTHRALPKWTICCIWRKINFSLIPPIIWLESVNKPWNGIDFNWHKFKENQKVLALPFLIIFPVAGTLTFRPPELGGGGSYLMRASASLHCLVN